MTTLVAMFAAIAAWVILFMVVVSFGWALARGLGYQRFSAHDLVSFPWIGYVALLGVLQLWHLFLPVSSLTLVVVLAVGLPLFIVSVRSNSKVIPLPRGASWWPPAIGAFAVVWLANRSLGPNTLWDSGLYHVPFIRWASSFAIVPGLGNLHDRFAFNNSSLLLHSMLEVGPAPGLSAHIINGFLCSLWIPLVVWSFQIILHGSRRSMFHAAFGVAGGVLVVTTAATPWISSTSTDVPAIFLGLAGCWQLLRLLIPLPKDQNSTEGGFRMQPEIGFAIVLLTGAVTVKLSSAALLIASIVVLAVVLKKRYGGGWRALLLGMPTTFCLILLLLWSVRGYVLSGYPTYPMTFMGAPVSWRVDPDIAARQRQMIVSTARTSHATRTAADPDGGWVRHWLVEVVLYRAPVLIVLPVLIILTAASVLILTRRARDALASPAIPLILAISCALIAWFVSAPDPRFAGHLWWMAAALAAGLAVQPMVHWDSSRVRWTAVGLCAALLVAPLLHQMALVQFRYRHQEGSRHYGHHALHDLPWITVNTFPAPLPKVAVEPRTTTSGLEVLIPRRGFLCWDSPLMCTTPPSFDPRLRLRQSGRVDEGFSIDPDSGSDMPHPRGEDGS
jgi:hypothetical protein